MAEGEGQIWHTDSRTSDKWDNWNLKQIEMLLFMYLCDNCDIAGFAEINTKRSVDTMFALLRVEVEDGSCDLHKELPNLKRTYHSMF